MLLSIIIPVLNEERCIGELVHYLTQLQSSDEFEIIVVDGGSSDNSVNIALNAGAKVISSPKGRAVQMNAGADIAKGDILYFLHADTSPPPGFDRAIIKSIQSGNEAGCFRMKFDHPSLFLKFFSWFSRINFRICRGGDQSLYTSKSLFKKLGGYDEAYTVYEDGEFISRLYINSKFAILPQKVITSARKYELRGKWALQFHFGMIHLYNFLGAGPEELHDYYKRKIAF